MNFKSLLWNTKAKHWPISSLKLQAQAALAAIWNKRMGYNEEENIRIKNTK